MIREIRIADYTSSKVDIGGLASLCCFSVCLHKQWQSGLWEIWEYVGRCMRTSIRFDDVRCGFIRIFIYISQDGIILLDKPLLLKIKLLSAFAYQVVIVNFLSTLFVTRTIASLPLRSCKLSAWKVRKRNESIQSPKSGYIQPVCSQPTLNYSRCIRQEWISTDSWGSGIPKEENYTEVKITKGLTNLFARISMLKVLSREFMSRTNN